VRRFLLLCLVTVLMISFFSSSASFQLAKAVWSGDVYISYDGSISPPNAPITINGSVYTLTDDIQGQIRIDHAYITLDGAGHRLTSVGSVYGVRTMPRAVFGNITVMNLGVSGFNYGISIPSFGYPYASFAYSAVIACNITNNGIGLALGPFNNTIIGNNISANTVSGIQLRRSPYYDSPIFDNFTFYLRNNSITENQRNLDFEGLNYTNLRRLDIDDSNMVNGKHVYCLFDEQNKTIPSDAGYVLLMNCTEISGHNLDLSHNSEGLFIVDSTNSTFTGSNMTNCNAGVRVYSSSGIVLQENNILENSKDGIDVQNSSNIVISESNVTKNSVHGIHLYNSTSNTLANNALASNKNGGLWFNFSSNNRVYSNNISGSKFGFGFIGNVTEDFMNDVDNANLIDNKPIYYLTNISDITVPSDAGYVALVNCSNIVVQNLNLTSNVNGLVTTNCFNVTVQNLNLQGNIYSVMSTSTTNSTITHITVTSTDYGVLMYDSSRFNQITENNVTANDFGISLQDSMNITVARNTAIGSWDVHLKNSSGNTIESNTLVSGDGMLLEDSNHNTIIDNEVTTSWSSEGILVYGGVGNLFARNNVSNYVEGIAIVSPRELFVEDNHVRNCGSCVIVESGTNVTLLENDLSKCSNGIELSNLNESSVIGNNVSDTTEYGITFGGQDSMILGNIISGNFTGGIVLSGDCNNDTISGNKVYGNVFTLNGIIIAGTNNTVTQNLVSNTPIGVQLTSTTYATLSENTIEQCNREAVYIVGGTSNYIIRNNIRDNLGYSMRFLNSDHNIVFENNFINNHWNNSQILFESPSTQDWNATYPIGGNYWESYSGTDFFQGAYQNQIGSDGMIDKPFILDANNTDQYPLTKPYSPHDIGLRLAFSKTIVAKGYNITLSINATILNYDLQTQTSNFSYVMPGTSIGEEVTISPRNSTIFNYELNTTNFSYGYYLVQSSVSPVQNETDLSDNNLTRYIRIVVPGDVSSANQGVPDGTVNMRDITYMILFFNTKPNSVNWNPNVDVNSDQVVNMRDIQIAILNFNKHE
jgi:parallel beta-helix repeat protein